MNAPRPNALGAVLRDFFADHLPRHRGMSPHTVRSYRDTLTLFLRFVSATRGCPVATLDLDHIGPSGVLAFLRHLEEQRRNAPSTRNVRLAAIHALFRYLATRSPECLEQSQRILAVPFKRARARPAEYLEYEEIEAVLAAIDRRTPDGRRDYALLVTMFNTGARAQEIVDLRPCDLQLVRPCHARLMGKGRKERTCPLWTETGQLLHAYLCERGIDPRGQEPVFVNHRRAPLTRFGVRYILAKYGARARAACPSLAHKRLHPHTMRHSTAVHLLQAGVDLTTISHWLGHASVNTTNRYATIDLEMKRDAIGKIRPIAARSGRLPPWRADGSILAWLESL